MKDIFKWLRNYGCDHVSLRGKRSRTKRMKFGPREGVFLIRAARKMGREQKGERKGVGFLVSPNFSRGPSVENSFALPSARISLASDRNACYAGYDHVFLTLLEKATE